MKFASLKCSLFSLKEYVSTPYKKTAKMELCFQLSRNKLAWDLETWDAFWEFGEKQMFYR